MYSLAQLKRGLRTPTLFFRELNRLYHRRLNRRQYNTDGVDIFAEDWDNLLILDACRYDMLERVDDLGDSLEHRVSRGSATPEFLVGNVHGRELLDTVYVTANPQLYRNRDRIDTELHDIVNVWDEEGWNEQYGTVLPETVVAASREASDRYPNKRLVVHFMQPHYPFLTDETEYDKGHLVNPDSNRLNVWNQIVEGLLDRDPGEVVRLYRENLERTLPSVRTLTDELSGKTVVTSDHGNMVGERSWPIPVREWGHFRGVYVEPLVKVPWLVTDTDERRTVVAEPPQSDQSTVESDVEQRLAELGYA